MTNSSPLVPTPTSLSVQDAFDRYYAHLVTDLTQVCGSPVAAEAAVDEAFRLAASDPDFPEVGRPREWLLLKARNHIVRRTFRQTELAGGSPTGLGGFERPTLAASIDRARGAHRSRRARLAMAATVAAAIAGAVVLNSTEHGPWAPLGSQRPTHTPASPSKSTATSATSATTTPVSTPSTSEAWPPPFSGIIGNPASVRAYTVTSPDTPGSTATVWRRCRANPVVNGGPPCDPNDLAQAVEVRDRKGRSSTHLVAFEQVVRPAFNGTFALLGQWDGGTPVLISPTMAKPRPFTVKSSIKPKAGQVFSNCPTGPCLVDLHGVLTMVDVPAGAQWHWDTTHGWVGTQGDPSPGTASMTALIQQANGTFASVEVTVKPNDAESPYLNVEPGPDGVVTITMASEPGFGQVAVSTDRGRTWQFRWLPTTNGPPYATWQSAPVVMDAAMKVSPLKPVP